MMYHNKRIVVIHGPNLNFLGTRDHQKYGLVTLSDINKKLDAIATSKNLELDFFQSNSEGEIVTKIQQCIPESSGLLINPAAYSHTSIAITDALEFYPSPVVEVHLTNLYKREECRRSFVTGKLAHGIIMGFQENSYYLGLHALIRLIEERGKTKV